MIDFRKQFENDGFCVFEGFLSDAETEELRNRGEHLAANMPEQSKRVVFSTVTSENNQSKDTYFLDSSDKISYFYEEGAVDKNGELVVDAAKALNKIGHALHDLDPAFKKITFDERIKEICYQLGFEDPAVAQSMFIFKNPGASGEVVPHQDASYLHTDPVKVIGFWIALEDATLENGCLKFITGSHKSGVHRRYIRNPDKASSELLVYDKQSPFYQKSNFTPVPVSKGSCILIDGLVVHASDPNRSSKSRPIYTFHVIEQNGTHYSEDNWLQPKPDKQFLKLYKN